MISSRYMCSVRLIRDQNRAKLVYTFLLISELYMCVFLGRSGRVAVLQITRRLSHPFNV